jgi:pimeloyl-ACP methyl ester carboxylesterase
VNLLHSTRLAAAVLAASSLATLSERAVRASEQAAVEPASRAYVVFLQSRPAGREEVSVIRQADGWIVRGTSRIGPPVNIVTRAAEIQYTADWRPIRMSIEGTSRGEEVTVKTTFTDGKANNEISIAGTQTAKVDAVAADTLVLPNALLASYAVLARRLADAKPGATFRAYIAPQVEVEIRVDGVFQDRVETAQRAINASRYSLVVTQPSGELQLSLWAEPDGSLLRLSIPLQGVELAREDIASAASRTTSFSLPGDEAVRIPASGFNLAGSLAKPAGASAPLPAIVLVGGSGRTDRDSTVFGIPIMGQVAAALVDAGFLVVRYDKRGVGQSGGRAEAATILDYVEDLRAVVAWLQKRKDVDKRRIGVVGHSEGAWVALAAAARDKRITAIAMIAGPGTPGADVVLEQQAHLFDRMKTPEAERQEKVALQKTINAAVLGKGTWEGVSDPVRQTADIPWFQSYLSFDPARHMKDVRQPLLIVHGELDTQVPPHHADKLAALARARKRNPPVDVVKVPGVNHLLVPAATGEVDEYATLTDKKVSNALTSAIALWMAKALGTGGTGRTAAPPL